MENLTEIFLIVVGLIVLWIALRFFLRLTGKIFSCGCAAILAVGLFLAFLRLWQP
jgi:hypothetical protein